MAPSASPQYSPERFSGTVTISPPVISAYYRQAPIGVGKLSFPGGRPPVNVSCKGGRSPNTEGVRNTLVVALRDSQLAIPKTGLALPSRKPIAWGIFGMNEPIITCPHCKAEVRLTESLAAPLIQAKVVEREREVARRESAIQAKRADLARAVELAEQQLTTRLKTEREIAAEEAKRVQLSELERKSQEVAHLQRELQECETKLAEAENAKAELIRKQGELEDEKRQLALQIETSVQESQSDIRHKTKQEAEDALRLDIMEKEKQIASMQRQLQDLEQIYQYLTGPGFRQRIEAIVEKFSNMQTDLERERKTMMRLRAKREGQIKDVIESTVGMYGDLQRVAGRALEEIDGLTQIARRVEARRKRVPPNHRVEPTAARGRTH